MTKKRGALPVFKVWIEVEAYDDETGEAEDVDLGFAESAEFTSEEDAVDLASKLHDIAGIISE